MPFEALPRSAAWEHRGSRIGFEVVFTEPESGGCRFDGHTSAVEEGAAWIVGYSIRLDADWLTRSATVRAQSTLGELEVTLEGDGAGGWLVDGVPARHLDGCLDVDLEASAFTNALPVHRLRLEVGQSANAAAAYVRAPSLAVERLEQHYTRVEDAADTERYDYSAPRFDYRALLAYDRSGLVLDYPGIAIRAASPVR